MMNFSIDTKSSVANSCSAEEATKFCNKLKRELFKAGLREYSEADLSLYLECIVEVLNEKKDERSGKNGID